MPDLIRARNDETGAVAEVLDTDHYLKNGWTRVGDDTPALEEERALYDPSANTVEAVTGYLALVDEAERDRVLTAEKTGKARKGVLDWQPVSE